MQLVIDLSDKKNRMNELAEAVKMVSGGASVVVSASMLEDSASAEELRHRTDIGRAASGNFSAEELDNPAINLGAAVPQTVAPANAGATPAAAVAGVELDAAGVPWDSRIHSDAEERKTAKGFWKKRRGVDDLTCSRIHNELLQVMAAKIGAPAGVLTPPPPAGNPVNVPHQEAVAVPGNPDSFVIAPPPPANPAPEVATAIAPPPPAPAIAPPPAAPAVIAPPPAQVPGNFNELVVWVTANHENNGGKLTAAAIDAVCKVGGLVDGDGNGSIQNAVHRTDLIDWLHTSLLGQMGA